MNALTNAVDMGGLGPDTVSLNLSEDYYDGDAEFFVTVDGVQVGQRQTVGALRSSGSGQDFTFRTSIGSGSHVVGVTFTNDAYGGTAATDRNLFLNAVTVNGVDQNVNASMYSAGTFSFGVGTRDPIPAETVIGSGSQTLSLSVCEDAYQGDAQFDVTVDGKVVATGLSAQALRAAGESQLFTIKGEFGAGPHAVGITFTNDAYAGTATTDRNLYVTSVKLDGAETLPAGAGALMSNGTVATRGSFATAGTAQPPAVTAFPTETVIGSGSQTLSLSVCEDAYQGDAQFDVTVDGKVVATGLSAQALRAAGESQLFTIKGEFGAGAHTVGITFTNDAYAGTAATDRNLYVTSVKLDGIEVLPAGAGTLMSNGTIAMQGSFATPGAGSTTTPPDPAPPAGPARSYGADGTQGLVAVGAPVYAAGAHVITVGAGKDFTRIDDAIAASRDGDVLLVDAGTYTDQSAKVHTNITIIGVGGRVVMNTTVDVPNQKGILVAETGLRVVNIDFVGAHISDELGHNAAGIRVDGGTIVVENCQFVDNQNGILTNPGADTTLTVDHSVFDHNGGSDDNNSGNTHNIYVGDIKSFSLTNSISREAQIGHEVKSRAEKNFIDNNLIESGTARGTGSYAIDLPNGGKDVISNNTIVKGPGAENRTIIHFGGEGIPYAKSSLEISGNIIKNDMPSATGILNQTSTAVTVKDNRIEGLDSSAVMRGPGTLSSNVDGDGTAFADSTLVGILPGNTAIFGADDMSAHHVVLDGGTLQAVQGGGGQLTADVVAGHVVVIGGSGGMVINESSTSGTGGNQYTTAVGSTNVLNLTGGGTIDSEGSDTITTGNGNTSGQLNGVSQVVHAGAGTMSWGVNGTSTIRMGTGSTFVALGGTGELTLTGTSDFFSVDGSGGNLRMDTLNGGAHVSGTVLGGAWSMRTYDGMVHMTTATGSQGVVMTMGDGDVQFISKGADEFHAGSGKTTVQVAGNAKIYAGSGALDFYGFGSSGADFYGNGGTYYLGGDTGNITYHGGDLASTLNNQLGSGTILGGAGRLTINFSVRDTIVGGSGGIVLNQNGGGADTISTLAGSSNVLNLSGSNIVVSRGDDVISWGAANGTMALYGTSTVDVLGGVSTFTVAGATTMTVAGGHDAFTLLAGSSATLDMRGYHSIHGDDSALDLRFTSDQGLASEMRWQGGTVDAWTDDNGGIHAETSGTGSTVTASGSLDLTTRNTSSVVLGEGSARILVGGAGASITAGSGDATIVGGWETGSFSVTGGAGAITADAGGSMAMTFIGGSGDAILSGKSVAVVGGSGTIRATGNAVTSFVGGTGSADISLADGARVTLDAGTSHFTELGWGAADLFTLRAGSIGAAIIDGFRPDTDRIALTDGVTLASSSFFGGSTHLLFSNGGEVTLSGVTDVKASII